MREILFRGKTYEGEWVQGSLVTTLGWGIINGKRQKEYRIYDFHDNYKCVVPYSVGQYTGLTDKKGKKIFEGDTCRVTRHCILAYGTITFKNGSFWFAESNSDSVLELSKAKINQFEIEVLGTIYDYPELRKEGADNG